jgi:8-oxo-dGTP pyrophosphatase MutT (NUDIX family)
MSETYILPLTRAEEAGKKPVRLVRAAARIALIMQGSDERTCKCLFVRHQTKGLELPGGAIEFGETPIQAGLRELSEEAGIQLSSTHSLTLVTMIPIADHRGGCWLDIIYGTTVRPHQIEMRQESELPVQWLTAEEVVEQVDQQLSSYDASLTALSISEQW